MTDFVDPEELPFTQDELFNAGRLFLPDDASRDMASHLAQCGPGVIESREQRRATWRSSGMDSAHWMSLHAWSYPADLLPALASLSSEAETRALLLMEERWRSVYRNAIAKLQQEALEKAGLIPTREEIVERATAAAATKKAKRHLKAGLAFQGPPPPVPTTAMVVAAHAAVAAERAKWALNVARFRDYHADGSVVGA